MNRFPILLAGLLSLGIWTAPLEAALTLTFSPNETTGSTILTLSGGFYTTSSGFDISDHDGLWDFFENDGQPLQLVQYIFDPLKITIWGWEPTNPDIPLTISDGSAVSPTGSDGVYLGYPFGFEKGAHLEGTGSYPMDDLPFSKFKPGNGQTTSPAGAPFAVVVEDGNGPMSPVPEPAGMISFMVLALIVLTVWRRSLY